ncbi:GNAT family N-acetyltransferase [soil metagenome]
MVPPLPGRSLTTELEVSILSRVNEVPREAWDALCGEDSSPFVEWTWLDCLEEAGCVGSERAHSSAWGPCHLVAYMGTGKERKLVAAAPMYMKGNSEGEFVFDWSWADASHRMGRPYYPKLVIAVPFTPATGERILVLPGLDREAIERAFAQTAKKVASELGAQGVHLLFPPERTAEAWVEQGYLLRYGVQYHFKNAGYATWDDFLASFNAKRRHQLKREVGQAEKDGVVIRTLAPEELTESVAHTMFRFYGVTVDKFSWGRRYLNRKFFELVAERFRHRLAWVFAIKDGTPIAGAFNVEKGKRLYGRYWGADVEMPFLHFNVCYYHGVKYAIERGLDVFEPGAGGEHKRVRGFAPSLTYSAHHVEAPRLSEALIPHLAREREALARYVETGGNGDEP